MLRAELSESSVSTLQNGRYDMLLNNRQKFFASEYSWAFLETRYDVAVVAGDRYLDVPAGLNLDRPLKVETKFNNIWQPLEYGIGPEEYNVFDSDSDNRGHIVQRWMEYGSRQVTAPTTGSGAVTPGGSLTGNYQYYVSYVLTDDSETSAYGLDAGQVYTNGDSRMELVLPVSTDTAVVGRRLYRTNATLEGPYFLIDIEDNTNVNYIDNASDTTLGAENTDLVNNDTRIPMFEVWPIPTTDQTIRFTGQRVPEKLENANDCCDIDDLLLVLFVAGEELQRLEQKNASAKLAFANARLVKLRATTRFDSDAIILGQKAKMPRRKIIPIGIAGGPTVRSYSGNYALANGAFDGIVTYSALGWTPVAVNFTVTKPAGGLEIFATLVEGTLTATSFQFTLSAATDSADYVLNYIVTA